MSSQPGALVVGGNLRALGIARSLNRRGVQTWLVDDRGDDRVARASRHVSRTLPPLEGNVEQRGDGLLGIAARHRLGRWTLFPTDDESGATVAKQRAGLATRFVFTSPGWEVFRYAYHKRLTHELAERIGIEYPWTRYPRTAREASDLACSFPAILKPDVKRQDNPFTRAKAWRVDDRAALLTAWSEAASLVGADAVMVQELIPGCGQDQYSFAALCSDGEPLATLVARRARQYPRHFGRSSSLVETLHAPEVEDRGRAIVAALDWSGLVEIEFKHDRRDDSYKLLDINGRVWTWHALGPLAGVDFAYLAWRLAQGLSIEPVRARPGVRWVRLATDVPSALGAMRAGELSLRDWARSLRRPRQAAVFAFDDPLPSLVDPAFVAWRMISRRRGISGGGSRVLRPQSDQSPSPASLDTAAAREFA
jgi:D-aspartate ligase